MIKLFRVEFTRTGARRFPDEYRQYLVQAFSIWGRKQADDKELAKLMHNMYELGLSIEVPKEKELITLVMNKFYRLDVVNPEWAARFCKTVAKFGYNWSLMDNKLRQGYFNFLHHIASKKSIYVRGSRFTEVIHDMHLLEVKWEDIPYETQEALLNMIPMIIHDFNRYETLRLLVALGELKINVKDFSKQVVDSVLLLYMGVVRLKEYAKFHRIGEVCIVIFSFLSF